MARDDFESLTILGTGDTIYPASPQEARLETFPNRYSNRDYLIQFNCPEFTSLCPVTGQPDFARIIIIYIPNTKCVESKSLKLYLGSFRNAGMFHEEITNRILEDIRTACEPRWLRVRGRMNSRGGISIDVIADHAQPGYEVPWQLVKAGEGDLP